MNHNINLLQTLIWKLYLIFKCELLNENNKEINNYIGFEINIIRDNVNKDYSKYINKNTIALINDFYKKDFELFNYDMVKN